MSESANNRRGRLEVITELYELTREMEKRRDNADFLILSVERRQDLMDEYDLLKLQNVDDNLSDEIQAEMKRMVKEIISMDTSITLALDEHKNSSKKDLAKSNSQQKVMGYMNQAISSAGSYMDVKK